MKAIQLSLFNVGTYYMAQYVESQYSYAGFIVISKKTSGEGIKNLLWFHLKADHMDLKDKMLTNVQVVADGLTNKTITINKAIVKMQVMARSVGTHVSECDYVNEM